MKYSVAIFDFDGTLFDTGEGITECVSIALDELGYPPLSQEDLESFIGPSLYDSFGNKCGITGKDAEIAIQTFRKHYHAGGIYKSHLYEGMLSLLESLKKNGIRTAIASSKPQIMIEKLLDKYNLNHLFDNVIGADGAEKSSKKAGYILSNIDQLKADKKSCLMVGDRIFDISAAKEAGIDSVYVLYGYGNYIEMVNCNPTYYAKTVEQLGSIIFNS